MIIFFITYLFIWWIGNRTNHNDLSFFNHKQVLKFGQQQKSLVATMRRFSVMKKESSVTRDVKLKAESVHRRLDALSKQAQRTEDQLGPTSVTTRIQRSQHAALLSKFQKVQMIVPLCFGKLCTIPSYLDSWVHVYRWLEMGFKS